MGLGLLDEVPGVLLACLVTVAGAITLDRDRLLSTGFSSTTTRVEVRLVTLAMPHHAPTTRQSPKGQPPQALAMDGGR